MIKNRKILNLFILIVILSLLIAIIFYCYKRIYTIDAPVITISFSNTESTITYKKISGAKKYYIYRSIDNNNYEEIARTESLNYVDKNIDENVLYYYYVKAYNGKVYSKNSNIVFNSIDFNYNLIKEVNNISKEENYLLSPLSIEYTLSMLEEGASGQTLNEIKKAIKKTNLYSNINIQDKIVISNALFINNIYSNDISKNYINNIKNKYDGDIIFDDFKTVNTINNWVSTKTNGMIKEIVNDIKHDTVSILINAIMIDLRWKEEFLCSNTNKSTFKKIDGTTMNAIMMFKESKSNTSYYKNDEAEGISMNYEDLENGLELEYLAIMPKDINKYISELSEEKIENLLSTEREASKDLTINLKIPRYTYDYELEDNNLEKVLGNLGIISMYDSNIKNKFNVMINKNSSLDLTIDKSIHKTHIEFLETGTRAAAITGFTTLDASAILEKKESINITFDKPFIYMIRDKENGNIIFFGAVYEPDFWTNDTIKCKY